jgi:predicted ferric reductase
MIPAAALTSALWYLGRGTGITALVLLTVSVVLGIVTRSGRAGGGLTRFGIADLHRTAALTGAVLVAVHVGSLLFDPYSQLKLVDLVLPFLASYRPLYLGLGALALDLLLAVVVTSLLRHRLGPRTFRLVHWATYVLWPVALLHGLGAGTDAGALWFRAIAAACATAFAVALGWRASGAFTGRGWQRLPRTAR